MNPGPFLAISLLLVVLWIASLVMLNLAGVLVHLLLLLAILFLAGHLVSGTTTT